MGIEIQDLIDKGKVIQQGLTYINPPHGVMRMYDAYRLLNVDEYYSWKEISIRFLQLYYPTDLERFVEYSQEFEKHCYLPRYISNMLGVLEACATIPSEKIERISEGKAMLAEMNRVQELEQKYLALTDKNTIHKSCNAFHDWHAAACVLFDKCFYSTDEDWVKFQTIDGDGNGYMLQHEYDKIYSSYRKLIARINDGRGIKGISHQRQNHSPKMNAEGLGKINIFISYSHADTKWLEMLKKHLKVFAKYAGSIEYWEDTKLRGGDKWREEITKAISNANVAILLVSTDFLASDFIASDELPPILRKAEEDGTRIIPLIVAPCAFDISELEEFQAINSPDQTMEDFGDNKAAIDRVFLELMNNLKSSL